MSAIIKGKEHILTSSAHLEFLKSYCTLSDWYCFNVLVILTLTRNILYIIINISHNRSSIKRIDNTWRKWFLGQYIGSRSSILLMVFPDTHTTCLDRILAHAFHVHITSHYYNTSSIAAVILCWNFHRWVVRMIWPQIQG